TDLEHIVEMSLERTVVVPLESRILKSMMTKEIKAREAELKKKLEILSTKSQDFFGIPVCVNFKDFLTFLQKELQSPNRWMAAIQEMSNIDSVETPTEKLEVILLTAKAIYVAVSVKKATLLNLTTAQLL